ncbi:helix-turn-helix transcriptional regulator [Marinibaculum pumilum]|uniref:Helix-turn-helix transcriptional regulator n=1 Tax=Marinibaculum pumilum TaxID=1766165 RepID=A0ABV7L927_9PROT
MPDVEWLLREAADARPIPVGERIETDDAQWRCRIERLEIGPGLRLFLTDVQARRDIAVEAQDDRTDRWIGSQLTLSGCAEIDFLDGSGTRTSADNALLFRPSGRRAAYRLAAGTRFRSAGYGLSLERVERLLEGTMPAAMRPLLEPDPERSRILTTASDRTMRRLVAGLFSRELNGPLRRLMLEGAVLQLLAVQAAAAARHRLPPASQRLSARDRDTLFAARTRLLEDMRDPPTLGALAVFAGMPERRLTAGFRLLFGATPFELLRNERLDRARIVLETTRLPLKVVAYRVGYDHASNFVAAFAARFGAPPRRYLREARGSTAQISPSSSTRVAKI